MLYYSNPVVLPLFSSFLLVYKVSERYRTAMESYRIARPGPNLLCMVIMRGNIVGDLALAAATDLSSLGQT